MKLQSYPEKTPVSTYRHRFNYLACFIDAVGFPFGNCFFSPVTILPAFIRKLSTNSFWIGLTNAIHSSFFFLPQLLAASWIERMPIKRGYVLTLALIERFAILALIPQILLLGRTSPNLSLMLFSLTFAIFMLSMGFNGPAYFDLVAKVIPVTKRGTMYGTAGAIGGLLSIFGAWLAKYFLAGYEFPINFSLCFLVGFIILTITVLPLGFIDEPPSSPSQPKRLRQYVRDAIVILKEDYNFRYYIYSQIFLSAFGVVLGFLTAYTIDKMIATESDAPAFTAAMMIGKTIGQPFWGYVADKRGNQLVILINTGITCLMILWIVTANSIIIFYGIFALIGFLHSGIDIPSFNMTMEFSQADNLPTYTALRSSAVAPFRAALPLFSGLIIETDKDRYTHVFLACILLLLLSWHSLWKVKEPRYQSPEQT